MFNDVAVVTSLKRTLIQATQMLINSMALRFTQDLSEHIINYLRVYVYLIQLDLNLSLSVTSGNNSASRQQNDTL